MTTSTDLVPLAKVEDILLHGGVPDTVSADEIQADIVRRILSAETLEQAFSQATTTPAKDLDGLPVTIHGVAWAPSGYDEGPGVYALLDVTREGSDEHEVVSMGGRTLMASLLWAQRNEAMPMGGVFRLQRSKANPERGVWTFHLDA